MDKFKVYRLREVDKKVVAAFEQSSLAELDPGEVVIRVGDSCVNYKDALAATGAGKIIRRFPCVGGIDLAGTVTDSQDPRFKKGDAVIGTSYDIGVAHDGGYSEYARLKADWIVPMPKGMSLFEAMALGTAGFTAGLAVVRMEHEGLKPGDGPVIVTGATGGVGSIAIDILAGLGHPVVALTGHALAGISEGAKRAGCAAFVTKPCLPEDLVKEIRRVLDVSSTDHKKTRRSGRHG